MIATEPPIYVGTDQRTGEQVLVTIFPAHAQVARRADRWETWGPPVMCYPDGEDAA